MLEIKENKRFLKEFSKIMQSKKKSTQERIDERLKFAIKCLQEETPLPQSYNAHSLNDSKEYVGCEDCHILGNLVLIYKIDKKNKILYLLRINNHPNLGITEHLLNTHNYELVETLLNEGGTYRIYSHLKDDDKWVIISPYRSNKTDNENKENMKELKSIVKNSGYSYTELKAVWTERDKDTGEINRSNEYSLLIYNMGKRKAIELGKKYEQSSVLVKENDSIYEYCTTDFVTDDGRNMSVGDVVNVFKINNENVMNISTANEILRGDKDGSVSVPTQGNSKPFTFQKESILESVFEVEPPRPSYFRNKEIYIPIYQRKE